MRRFVLDGHGGYYNRGCEAILAQTVKILRASLGDLRALVLATDARRDALLETDPDITFVSRDFAKWTPRWGWRKALRVAQSLGVIRHLPVRYLMAHLVREIDRADCVIHIGGDNYSFEYGFPQSWIDMADWLISRGKPYVLWAASLGPSEEHEHRLPVLAEHLRSLTLITVRESLTRDFLAELGVRDNVRQVADPAFLLEPSPQDVSQIMPGLRPACESYLGLNVSPYLAQFARGRAQEELLRELARFIKEVIKRYDLSVLLIPHVTHGPIRARAIDSPVLARLQELTDTENVGMLPTDLRAAETKRIIGACRAFMGARMHSTIAALSSGVPTLSLSYSMKAHGINHDIFGHQRYVLPASEITCNNLLDRLAQLFDEEPAIRNTLARRIPELQHMAYRGGEYVASVIFGEHAEENTQARPRL